MASIDMLKKEGTRLVMVTQMPQSLRRFIPRSPPSFVNPDARSIPQLSAELALTETAIKHRGDYGTVQMPNGTVISKAAFDIGNQLRNADYGGMSYEERLKKNQTGAEVTREQLKALIRKRHEEPKSRRGEVAPLEYR